MRLTDELGEPADGALDYTAIDRLKVKQGGRMSVSRGGWSRAAALMGHDDDGSE